MAYNGTIIPFELKTNKWKITFWTGPMENNGGGPDGKQSLYLKCILLTNSVDKIQCGITNFMI